MSASIVVAAAARTPVGSFNGAFAATPAHELGAVAIKAALERAGVDASEVDEVILGQILTAGAGQNPARQASMAAGCPQETTAWGLNQLCGSGLRAVALGMQQIASGDARIIVAGGQESMSMAPHCQHLRSGVKMGDFKLIDTMIKDGLTDAFFGYHMGNTAENIARQWQLTRDQQDEFAVASQNKAEAAQKAGRFKDEIAPVTIKGKKGDTIVSDDEYIRHGSTIEAMQKLRPAFDKEGTVTAGNASGINDGAAAVVLMSEEEASRRGVTPLVRIVSWATAGVDPQIMGTGPIPASRKALEKAGWSVADLDLVEANEAFAAQACAVNKDMGWDPSIVNVNGGAIAIGHPVGASGARVFNTLVYEMKRRGARKGLATLCIGAAISVALKNAGYQVAANYAGNDEAAEKFKGETGIPVYKWSVADYEACAAGVKQVEADLGPVDILVNNAGITRDAMFHKMTPQQWKEVIDTNLSGVFNMTHPVWTGMRDRKFGRIITISSINAQKGQAGQVNYSASKAGDIGFSKALAQEGARAGITVNVITPGYIGTDMVKAIDEKVLKERIIPQIPVGRLGEPEEVARCVLFLASDDAGFITGSTISANGGQYFA